MKKRILKKIVDPVASRLGYKKITKAAEPRMQNSFSKNSLLQHFYEILKSIRFEPKHIIDVGANHGTWTRETLQSFPHAAYTLLEPQYWMKESVQDIVSTNANVKFFPVGAGKENGSFKFTIVDRDDSCSFHYSEAEANANGFKQIEVKVVTLNGLVQEENLAIPDIIKIDAEGLDLEVLEGANNFFGITEVFMVEAAVANKLFPNNIVCVINYMNDKGYNLFDITDLNRPFTPGVLWLAELVFVRKNGYIDSYEWNKA